VTTGSYTGREGNALEDPAGTSDSSQAESAEQPVSGAPPEPVASSTPKGPGVLATACRAAILFALLAAALDYAAQITFVPAWIENFIRANQITPEKRGMLLKTMLGAAFVGAAGAVVAIVLIRKRGRPAELVERAAWLVAPIGFVAFVPIFFRQAPWLDRAPELLAATGLTALLLEGAIVRSFDARRVLLGERAGFLSRFAARIKDVHRERATAGLVVLASIAYSFHMSGLGIRRHHNLQSGVYDLGISDNLMYNALAGHFMRSPIFSGAGDHKLSFIANHAQFGQYVLLPVYALWPRSETLIALQASLLGLAAIPLYFFARRRCTAGVSALVALAYLAYPVIHGASLYEMTYLPPATFFVMATIWALDGGRWVLFALSFACAVSMREDVPVGLAVCGVAFALSGHRTVGGLVLAALSAIYFVLVRFVIMERAGAWVFPGMVYGELLPPGEKESFAAVIRTIATNPIFVLSKMLKEQKLVYLMHLLVPVAFLPLRRGWALAALIPGTLLTLLSTNYGPTIQLGFHYALHWTPFLFLATPLVLHALRTDSPFGDAKMKAAAWSLAAASLIVTFHFGAFAKSPRFKVGFGDFDFGRTVSQVDMYQRMMKIISVIPKDASLSVSNTIGPHVSNRVEAYLSDNDGLQGAQYLAFAKYDYRYGGNRRFLRTALEGNDYGVVAYDADFVVLKAGPRNGDNDKVLSTWNP